MDASALLPKRSYQRQSGEEKFGRQGIEESAGETKPNNSEKGHRALGTHGGFCF